MGRVTDTFGSSVGHHNLMQVVGAHTLEEHRKTRGVIQYYNCIMTGYTITANAEITTHIQEQRVPPAVTQMRRVWKVTMRL